MGQYYSTMNLSSRFAPSPTGYLHLGNARTALFAWLAARGADAAFILRMEDTDTERSRADYAQAIMADLYWLGLDWDEGPDVGGAHGPYRQMERQGIYADLFARLLAQGDAYPCYCRREELEAERQRQRAAGQAPRYGGHCRDLSAEQRAAREAAGQVPTLRFRIPDAGVLRVPDLVWGEREYALTEFGDFVIRRADGSPAFFFANAVDDALMGVGLVLRGEDHLSNTPRQILILRALRLAVPQYGHLPLILGDDGQPLSKRNGAGSLRELREKGFLPEAVCNYLARLGHHYAESALMDMVALARGFATSRISRAPARFDAAQLEHWQQQALQSLPAERLWTWLAPALQTPVPADRRMAFVQAVRGNVLRPQEGEHWAAVCFGHFHGDAEARSALEETPPEFWAAAAQTLQTVAGDYGSWVKTLQAVSGRKGKALFLPLRAALTGRAHGPELAALLPLMGMERALARLAAAPLY